MRGLIIIVFQVMALIFLVAPGWSYDCPCGEGKAVEYLYPLYYQYEIDVTTTAEISIIIDTMKCVLTLMSNGKPLKKYPVALGKFETPTPLGNYRIIRKAMHWGSGFGSRWLELNVPWGLYGIHGTNKPWSIGTYASQGCIRLHNNDVEELYSLVSLGTPVIIVGNPFTYREPPYRELRRDFCGSDVMEVQRVLKQMGLYEGKIDGIWRWDMEESIYKFRQMYGLPRDNSVDEVVYEAFGI